MPRLAFDLPPDVADRVIGFTGRAWALDRINQWVSHSAEPLLVVTARPGVGKTALAARLVQMSRGDAPTRGGLRENWLHAAHFCRQARYETVDAVSVLKSLSAQLCATVPTYAEHVLASVSNDSYTFNVRQQADLLKNSMMVGVQVIVDPTSPQQAFLQLVRRPLTEMSRVGDLRADIVIVVDALDETVEGSDDRMTLARLLAIECADPVPGLRLLVTTRPGRAGDYFEPYLRMSLDDDEPADSNDVHGYVKTRLRRMRWRGPAWQSLTERIVQASDGNFLYAALVLDGLKNRVRGLANLPDLTLPSGLDGIYEGFLKREIAAERQSWREAFRPVLGVLVQSRGDGLTRDQIAQITGLQLSKIDSILDTCTPYLRGRRLVGPFIPYHESFREYLRGEGPHHIYPAEATWNIITGIARNWMGCWQSCSDPYIVRHILGHLRDAVADPGSAHYHDALMLLRDIASDPGFLEVSLTMRSIDELLTDYGPGLTSLGVGHEPTALVRGILAGEARRPHHDAGEARSAVLQQLQHRAMASGHDELAASASRRLEQRAMPYARLLWTTNPSSGFEILGHHGGAKFLVTAESRGRSVVATCGFQPQLWDLDGEFAGRALNDPSLYREPTARAACLGDLRGRKVVAVAGDDYIRLWDLASHQAIGMPIRSHSGLVLIYAKSITIGSSGGRDYVAVRFENYSKIVDAEKGYDFNQWQSIRMNAAIDGLLFSSAGRTGGGLYVVVPGGGLHILRYDGSQWLSEQIVPAQAVDIPHIKTVLTKEVSGRPVVVFHDTRTHMLMVKDMASGQEIGHRIKLQVGDRGTSKRVFMADIMEVPTGELLLAVILDQPFRGDQDPPISIAIWDIQTGSAFAPVVLASSIMVNSIALAVMRRLPVCLVLEVGTIRAYPLSRTVAEATSGSARADRQRPHTGWTYALTAGTWGGTSHAVSGHNSGSVLSWGLRTGEFEGQLLSLNSVDSLLLTMIDGQITLITPGGAWDPVRGTEIPIFQDRRIDDWIDSVAIGRMNGDLVLAYGSSGGVIKVRRLLTGEPINTKFKRHSMRILRIAVGELDGEAVVISHDGPLIRAEAISTGRQRAQWRATTTEITSMFAGRVAGESSLLYAQIDGNVTICERGGTRRLVLRVDAIPSALTVHEENVLLVGTTTGVQCYELRNLNR